MPVKVATRSHASGHGGYVSTRSAVDEIRRSTGEMLNAFMVARQNQTTSFRKELRKSDAAREKAVRMMMKTFREQREKNAREMANMLQNYTKSLHASVVRSKHEAETALKQLASKRKKFASTLLHSLAKTRQQSANAQHKEMRNMAGAREKAAHDLHSDLEHFAKGLHDGVSAFRLDLREQLGTVESKPVKAPKKTVKKSKPVATKAATKKTVKAQAKPKAKAPAASKSRAKKSVKTK